MTDTSRLTAEQQAEWAKQVEHVQPYVGHRTAGMWAGAIIAVDLELTVLRQQVEAQATQIEAFTVALADASIAVINGRAALKGAEKALLKAREALQILGNSDNYSEPLFDPWGYAEPVIATIDAALGGKEEAKQC